MKITIEEIIQNLKNTKKVIFGEKSLLMGEHKEKEYLISQWKLQKDKDKFVYEVHTYSNPKSNNLQGATELSQLQLVLTEQELIHLFQENKDRYFYNADSFSQ
jgi:predicted metal-dependent TIM-barrel fold hydrolase